MEQEEEKVLAMENFITKVKGSADLAISSLIYQISALQETVGSEQESRIATESLVRQKDTVLTAFQFELKERDALLASLSQEHSESVSALGLTTDHLQTRLAQQQQLLHDSQMSLEREKEESARLSVILDIEKRKFEECSEIKDVLIRELEEKFDLIKLEYEEMISQLQDSSNFEKTAYKSRIAHLEESLDQQKVKAQVLSHLLDEKVSEVRLILSYSFPILRRHP